MNKEQATEKRVPARAHSVTVENRSAVKLTGVTDVASFNEQEIVMTSDSGEIALLGAGLHLAFAFPMLRRLLMLFELQNVALFAWASVVTFAVFAVFYSIVYRVTSAAYYSIVSNQK